MKYSFITLLFFLCFLLLTTGCDQPEAIRSSGNTIKIGVIGPFSGPDRAKGEDGLNGIRAVMHMHPFLKNGDTVELIVEDDKNEPELSVKALVKLVTQDKVSAIMLLSSSSSGLAVNKIADSYQVPVLALVATHPDIARDKTFVSQLSFDNTLQGQVAALFVRDELLFDMVAVFHDPESFHSTSLAGEFTRKFEAIGGTIVKNTQVTADSDDFKDILGRLQKKKTQLLYLPVGPKEFIQISKALEDIGWTLERMGSDGLVSDLPRQYPEAIDLLEGVISIDLYSNDIRGTSFGEQTKKSYRKLFDQQANTFTAIGAEGYAILQQSMNRCGRPGDSMCINTMLHNTDNFEGILGRITIHADGKVERPLIVNRIRDGHTQFMVKVY